MDTPAPAPGIRPQSMRRRAILALALTWGYYGLAILLALLLLGLVLLQFASGHFIIMLNVVAFAGLAAIASTIFVSEPPFHAPWAQMTAKEQPRLFERLRHIAACAGQEMPEAVYIVPEANAWVSDYPDANGRGTHRVMGIGLPLLQLLDVSQLSAVIAHEFGHYHGGDTRLIPRIYGTRVKLLRTLQRVSTGRAAVLEAPFQAYAKMYLRVTNGISRQQEYAADAFAGSIEGPRALGSALERLAAYEPAFEAFWNKMALPVLQSGYRPSLMEGVARITEDPRIAGQAADFVRDVLSSDTKNEYDTHPALQDRLAALGVAPAGPVAGPDRALTLIDNLPQLEEDFLCLFLSEEAVRALRPIAWDDVAEKVWMEEWRSRRDLMRTGSKEPPYLMDQLPQLLAGVMADAKEGGSAGAPPAVRYPFAASMATSCFCLALHEHGWTLELHPVLGVTWTRGDEVVDPYLAIGNLMEALETYTLDTILENWKQNCAFAGIAGVPMTGSPAAETEAI